MSRSANQPIGFFERYLSVWVARCIAAGIGLGSLYPKVFQSRASLEYGSVNFIVAVLIWLMVCPDITSRHLYRLALNHITLSHRQPAACAERCND